LKLSFPYEVSVSNICCVTNTAATAATAAAIAITITTSATTTTTITTNSNDIYSLKPYDIVCPLTALIFSPYINNISLLGYKRVLPALPSYDFCVRKGGYSNFNRNSLFMRYNGDLKLGAIELRTIVLNSVQENCFEGKEID
jgi:hypothetical protein